MVYLSGCLFSSPTLQSPSGFKPEKESPSPSPSRGRGRGSCRGHKGLVSPPSTYSCSPQLSRAFKIRIKSHRIGSPRCTRIPIQDGILLVRERKEPTKKPNQSAEFHEMYETQKQNKKDDGFEFIIANCFPAIDKLQGCVVSGYTDTGLGGGRGNNRHQYHNAQNTPLRCT